jgi:hypothetical protein
MELDGLRRCEEKPSECGRSHKVLGRPGWYGAEALAAAVPAAHGFHSTVVASPPEQTGLTLQGGPRCAGNAGRSRAAMNATDTFARPAFPDIAERQLKFADFNRDTLRNPAIHPKTMRRSAIAVWLANGIFCLSLWISLLAIIWLSRGWIGLFFGGQILSLGICLFQRLAKRTQYAICAINRSLPQFEGERSRS